MVKVRSILFDRGSKSMGNVTFRTVKRSVIVSAKIEKNESNTLKQKNQRNGFGATSKIARSLKPIIDIGYKKPAGWSRQTDFIKKNTAIAQYAREGNLYDYVLPPITNLCRVLKNPAFKGKIYTGIGRYDLYTSFSLAGDGSLEGVLRFGRDFVAEDVITVGVCYSFTVEDVYFEQVRLFEKRLTEEEVEGLSDRRKFVVNKTTFPGIDVPGELPEGASGAEYLVTGLVSDDKEGCGSVLGGLGG